MWVTELVPKTCRVRYIAPGLFRKAALQFIKYRHINTITDFGILVILEAIIHLKLKKLV